MGTEEQKAAYQDSEGIESEDAREQVYRSLRPAMMEKIRSSQKIILRTIRGFWNSPLHVKKMFQYLTGVEDLSPNIEKNLSRVVQYFEKYLIRVDKTPLKKVVDEIEDLTNEVMTTYEGNNIYKMVMIMRMFAKSIDSDGRGMFLLEDEDIITDSPFLKVYVLPDRFVLLLLRNMKYFHFPILQKFQV